MKKILLILCIFPLIIITALIKNSTKKIEDQIYVINENIESLNAQLGDELLDPQREKKITKPIVQQKFFKH